jgi:hypothetical protein
MIQAISEYASKMKIFPVSLGFIVIDEKYWPITEHLIMIRYAAKKALSVKCALFLALVGFLKCIRAIEQC